MMTNKTINDLRQQLSDARKTTNLSQEDMAGMLHTNRSNISRLESPNSKNIPNLDTVCRYVEALGMELEIRIIQQSDKGVQLNANSH